MWQLLWGHQAFVDANVVCGSDKPNGGQGSEEQTWLHRAGAEETDEKISFRNQTSQN